MKHIISILFFFLIAGTYVTSAQKFHFGLMASPGMAWLKTDTKGVDNDGVKLGFSYGIVTEFAFNDAENYAFATGLQASYRGGRLAFDSVKLKLNLQYLELPITIKMKTNEIGAIKYFGQFGIVPGYNLKAIGKTTVGNTTKEDDYKDGINTFNFSLLIALGLEYNLTGNTSGFVSVGFNNGLNDVIDDNDTKALSNLLSLNLGVLF